MRKTVTIMLVAVLALALVPAAVLLIPTVSAAAPVITLAPTSQIPGASVSVAGTGFGATKAVGIGFGVEVNVINETMPVTGPFDVGTGPYIGYLSHLPIKPGTFTMSESFGPTSVTFFKMFDDAGNGSLIKASAIAVASIVNATMNYVTGQFAVFTIGPVSSTGGFVRIVNYTYYQYNVTPAAGVTTSATGAFQAAFTVPSVFNGTHTVTAIDTQGNTATALFTVTGSAVKPPTGWSKTYGGANAEGTGLGYPKAIQTNDGGFLMTGDTTSYGAGGRDAYLVKTDANGNMQWNKTYGGPLDETACEICKTSDGGYAVMASTSSYGAGDYDFWLLKIDAAGNMQWNKTYGGAGNEEGETLVQTADGGYAIISTTSSFGAGGMDGWLIKTDSSGNILWNKTYGGSGRDYVSSIILTSDGGYAIAGTTDSFGAGSRDLWLIKTDALGVLPIKPSPAASAFCNVTVLPGWTWYFFVQSIGDVTPFTYQWYENTTLLQGQTSMVLSVTKSTSGTYTFYCKVTDSEGTSANSNNVTLTVMSY